MELVLVRHALPVRIDSTPDGSPADPGLDVVGQEQARRVLRALEGQPVTAIYSSPARRARQTAEPTAAALGLEITVLEGLDEFDSHHTSYVPVEQLKAEGDPRYHALVRGDLYSASVDPVVFRVSMKSETDPAWDGSRMTTA